jgi:hypothetical protein
MKPSAVRGVVATVDKRDMVRKLGTLSAADLESVEHGLAQVLGFLLRPPTRGSL